MGHLSYNVFGRDCPKREAKLLKKAEAAAEAAKKEKCRGLAVSAGTRWHRRPLVGSDAILERRERRYRVQAHGGAVDERAISREPEMVECGDLFLASGCPTARLRHWVETV